MCHQSVIYFSKKTIKYDHVHGKKVLEVGSANFNGGIRQYIENFQPESYTGTDIQMATGVDLILKAEELVSYFGSDYFDLIICTEVIEHIADWVVATDNFKKVLSPNGRILLSTRSIGFPYHGYPNDYWRFSMKDFRKIFEDVQILNLENDTLEPGVFLYAQKKDNFRLKDLSSYRLYSIISGRRELVKFTHQFETTSPDLNRLDWQVRRFLSRLPGAVARKFEITFLANA